MRKEWVDKNGNRHIEETRSIFSDQAKITMCGAFAGFLGMSLFCNHIFAESVAAFCVGYLFYKGTEHLANSYDGLRFLARQKIDEIQDFINSKKNQR